MFKKLMSDYITPLSPIPTDQKPSLSLHNPVRAILFDIYGTLFISKAGDISLSKKEMEISSALNKLLVKYTVKQSFEELMGHFYRSIENTHENLKKTGIDFPEVRIDRIWMDLLKSKDITTARQFALEYEMIVNPVWPMPDLTEVLKTLKNRNIHMGIISNAQFFTPYLFDLFCGAMPEKLGFHPDLIFYSFQHHHAKPSLYLFDKAIDRIQKIGLAPEEVLFVGNDMLNDIFPAHSVGFQTGLFAGDARSLRLRESNPNCNTLTPDAVFTNLKQLLFMLNI
jgi:putative hydrolase of the HAD superfamily